MIYRITWVASTDYTWSLRITIIRDKNSPHTDKDLSDTATHELEATPHISQLDFNVLII